MGSYSNKTWTCPFYGSSKNLCINCEGGRLPGQMEFTDEDLEV